RLQGGGVEAVDHVQVGPSRPNPVELDDRRRRWTEDVGLAAQLRGGESDRQAVVASRCGDHVIDFGVRRQEVERSSHLERPGSLERLELQIEPRLHLDDRRRSDRAPNPLVGGPDVLTSHFHPPTLGHPHHWAFLRPKRGAKRPVSTRRTAVLGLRWLLATSSFRRVQGLSLTSATVDDAPEIHDLYRRWERCWNVPLVTPFDEVAAIFADPHLEPDLDARMVRHGGRSLALRLAPPIPCGTRLERAFRSGKVDPVMRGCGIGRRLLAWQIERAVEKLRTCDPELPWYVRLEEWEWVDDAHHLFRRFGFAPARWFEDMVRPLDTPLDVAVPPGVEILPWSESTPEETLRVSNASFADHWGSTERTLDSWKHTLSSSSVRLDLSYVARAGGQLIGICL